MVLIKQVVNGSDQVFTNGFKQSRIRVITRLGVVVFKSAFWTDFRLDIPSK